MEKKQTLPRKGRMWFCWRKFIPKGCLFSTWRENKIEDITRELVSNYSWRKPRSLVRISREWALAFLKQEQFQRLGRCATSQRQFLLKKRVKYTAIPFHHQNYKSRVALLQKPLEDYWHQGNFAGVWELWRSVRRKLKKWSVQCNLGVNLGRASMSSFLSSSSLMKF